MVKPPVQEPFLYRPDSWFEPLKWEHIFPHSPTQPIHVDLGAGDGGLIHAQARKHPHINFLAVERLLGRARKIARKSCRDKLENLRVLRIEASYAVECLFPKKTIAAITVLFPDPWPKRRHQKNRLIQPAFLDLCASSLQPNGWLAIKTDDKSYFDHITETLAGCETLRVWKGAHQKELLPEITDFERDFLKEGRPIYFVAAQSIA